MIKQSKPRSLSHHLVTKKLCTQAGCSAIVDHKDDGTSPRCPKHLSKPKVTQKERQRKYTHHYDDQGRNVYSTYRWKKLRKAKATLNPMCEHCASRGVYKLVEEVDHIIEIEDGGEMWDINNLQSLCKPCHIVKTNKASAERAREVDNFGYLKRS